MAWFKPGEFVALPVRTFGDVVRNMGRAPWTVLMKPADRRAWRAELEASAKRLDHLPAEPAGPRDRGAPRKTIEQLADEMEAWLLEIGAIEFAAKGNDGPPPA